LGECREDDRGNSETVQRNSWFARGKEGVKPDYAKCVDIATTGALRELLPASIITLVVTLSVGFIGGIQALGGYLAGSILSGLLLALLMSNAGGLWDNAKKLIETGVHGGKVPKLTKQLL